MPLPELNTGSRRRSCFAINKQSLSIQATLSTPSIKPLHLAEIASSKSAHLAPSSARQLIHPGTHPERRVVMQMLFCAASAFWPTSRIRTAGDDEVRISSPPVVIWRSLVRFARLVPAWRRLRLKASTLIFLFRFLPSYVTRRKIAPCANW